MLFFAGAISAGLLIGTCGNKSNPAGTTGTLPVITVQPVSQSITVGDSVTFTVAATGDPAPTCQWQKDGAAVSGATSAAYRITSATSANGGVYRVIVTNSAGSDTSNPATLSVNPSTPAAPSIMTQPQSQTVDSGSAVTFVVVAVGNPAPACQWQKNGVDIANATSSTYTNPSASPADDGNYSVTVSNNLGTVSSGGALLRVNPGPQVLPYTVSNDTIRAFHSERINFLGTRCTGDTLVTTFDTIPADTTVMTYVIAGDTLTLTTRSSYFVYTVHLIRVGSGSDIVGTWAEYDTLGHLTMQVVFTATTFSNSLNGANNQPMPICPADQYLMSSWPYDSVNFNGTAVRMSCNGVQLTGSTTGEVVTMTWESSGNKTYMSTDGTHTTYTYFQNPVSCPNDPVPEWFYSGFLGANPRH
jgi:hypothetical protein